MGAGEGQILGRNPESCFQSFGLRLGLELWVSTGTLPCSLVSYSLAAVQAGFARPVTGCWGSVVAVGLAPSCSCLVCWLCPHLILRKA